MKDEDTDESNKADLVSRRLAIGVGIAAAAGAVSSRFVGDAAAQGISSDRLEFILSEMPSQIGQLLDELQNSQSAREAFLFGPGKTLLSLLPVEEFREVTVGELSETNKFLFTLLQDEGLMERLRALQRNIGQDVRFMSDEDRRRLLRQRFLDEMQSFSFRDFPGMGAAIDQMRAEAQGSPPFPDRDTVTVTSNVAVATETVVAVVAAAVVHIALTVIDFTPSFPDQDTPGFTPEELRGLSNELVQRAKSLQERNLLSASDTIIGF